VLARYRELAKARLDGQPIAYLTGEREFWSLTLKVNPHTLIPRPETETLVEWALSLDLPEQAQTLDLGTGSGAIALALASERPSWRVLGVDCSEQALLVARENVLALGFTQVELLRSAWFESIGERRFDLIVSNPPYVQEGDPHLAQGDLRFEPISALVAAGNGFADLQTLATDSRQYLAEGGWLLLEHGYTQGAAVREILSERGFSRVQTRCDLAGQERITGGCWHAE
jgi:release factor glutamine methyltransferase